MYFADSSKTFPRTDEIFSSNNPVTYDSHLVKHQLVRWVFISSFEKLLILL